ncbi:MAG: hypothetical protein ACI9F9_003302 [Candidatus Paceibacteria bacterium]|jgi:uncharacterized protein (DUF58 family)
MKLTRWGRAAATIFLLVCLLCWAAGGVALLFSAFGIAVWCLAAWQAQRQTRGIELRVLPGPPHWTGDAFEFELELRSVGRSRGPRRHLVITRTQIHGRKGLERPIGSIEQWSAVGPKVIRCSHRHLSRGREVELALTLDSSYPFGLLRSQRKFLLAVDMLGWPRLGSWRSDIATARQRHEGQDRQTRNDGQDEFRQLSPWRPGMSTRHMHWKLSERRGMWLVQELEDQASGPLEIEFINGLAGRAEGTQSKRSFETAVSLTATLVDHHLRRGVPVTLRLSEYPEHVYIFRGRPGRMDSLQLLSEVKARPLAKELLQEEVNAAGTRAAHLIVVVGGRGIHLPGNGHPRSPRVLDVDAPDMDQVFQRARELEPKSSAAQRGSAG